MAFISPNSDTELKSDKENRFIGYRFEATGVFGYKYYMSDENICSVTSIVAPSTPVMIISGSIKWRSDFEECTIFPGLTRYINDEQNNKQLSQIAYKSKGEYEINGAIQVHCDLEKYTFYRDDKTIAIIKRINEKEEHLQSVPNTDFDYEPYFEIRELD